MELLFQDCLENQAKQGLKEGVVCNCHGVHLNGNVMNGLPHVRFGGFTVQCAVRPIFKDSPKSQAQAVSKVGWSSLWAFYVDVLRERFQKRSSSIVCLFVWLIDWLTDWLIDVMRVCCACVRACVRACVWVIRVAWFSSEPVVSLSSESLV